MRTAGHLEADGRRMTNMTNDDLLKIAEKHGFRIFKRGPSETVVLCKESSEKQLARGLRFTARAGILRLEHPKAGPLTHEEAAEYLAEAAKTE